MPVHRVMSANEMLYHIKCSMTLSILPDININRFKKSKLVKHGTVM